MKNMCRLMVLLAGAWTLGGCGLKKPPNPSPKQTAEEKAAEAVEKAKKDKEAEIAKEHLRTAPKKDEFQLTLVADDPAVAQIDSIQVDVISTEAGEAARLMAEGPVKYRDSRKTGVDTLSHTFKKGGRFSVKVPSIPAMDKIVLWAELAAPAQGSDTRMLVIPLVLDKSDTTKVPVANPISVRLTANGWVRTS